MSPMPQSPMPQSPYGYQQPMIVQGPPSSGLAVASMVLGIVGLLGGWCFLAIPNLLAILLGHLGLKDTKDGTKSGRGMAVAGLVLGYVFFVPAIALFVLFGGGMLASVFSS
jgi:hypothetical protein